MDIRSLNPLHFKPRYLISGIWMNAMIFLAVVAAIVTVYFWAIPFLQSSAQSQEKLVLSTTNATPKQIKDLFEIQSTFQKKSYESQISIGAYVAERGF